MVHGSGTPTIFVGRAKRTDVVTLALGHGLGRRNLLGRNSTVDMMILDVALVSFVALLISLMVIPERRSAAPIEAAVPA